MKIARFFQLAALILLAAGAQPAYSAFWQWSKTAATNSGADPSINWAEGMSPSSVNDSARAMMARAAEYRDDISGLLTTAGSSSAFTVTTNQGLSSTPNDGQLLSFTVHTTNAGAPTLAADGGTAYPIQSAPGVGVASATLILGSPYSAKFSVANNAWMLKGFYGSTLNVPLGALVPYTLQSAPSSNFVFAAGQCLSTTTYAGYWAALGSPASGSCAGGQFRIIDMSGRVPAGMDAMPGFGSAGRLTGSTFGCGSNMTVIMNSCANGVEYQNITLAQLPGGITVAGSAGVTVSTPNGLASNVNWQGWATVPGNTGSDYVPWASSSPGGSFPNTMTGTVSMTSTSNNTSGQLQPNVQPTIAVAYLLRVL